MVIDVLRAFSTAAYALAAGTEKIVLTDTVENALQLRGLFPAAQIMGEVDGRPVTGFDFSNSPAQFESIDLGGLTLIQRTSAGTQGVVRSVAANKIWVSGFNTASATAKVIAATKVAEVSFVITAGSEDLACAEYLEQLLGGENPDFSDFKKRVRASSHAQRFLANTDPDFPASDVDLCLMLDRFSFAMPVKMEGDLAIIRAQYLE